LNNFEELWDELWHNKKSKNYEYEKTRSKKKFEDLDFPTLFKQIPHKPFKKPSWGFPKGRRYNNETDRQCAIREFMEETGLKRCDFKMVALSQFFEKYVGSNDAKYSHKYYLAIVKPNPGEFENIAVDPNNSQQTSEIGDIGWFNFEDATNLIRDYYEEKKKVLKRVNQIFENIKNRHIQSD
jgi:8-oxo-dGTP pyrophosphatase MutT (NUDIX family)